MKKEMVFILIFLVSFTLVYGITFTADATEIVNVPNAALATICLVVDDVCTDKEGEILFGNAVVESKSGDLTGLVLIQFGGNIYRSWSDTTVYNEEHELIGLRGKLSQLLPDGSEISNTGATRVYEDVKGSYEEEIPVGEFFIEYNGLVLESSDECSDWENLVEGEPVKGVSTRECTSTRGLMTSGEYMDIELVINHPSGESDFYRLVSIDATTSFEWEVEE